MNMISNNFSNVSFVSQQLFFKNENEIENADIKEDINKEMY